MINVDDKIVSIKEMIRTSDMSSEIRNVNCTSDRWNSKENSIVNGSLKYKSHFLFPLIDLNEKSFFSFRLSRLAVEATPCTPLSFEDALFMGRTGRVLPSTTINGFSQQRRSLMKGKSFEIDEEDWC